MHGYECSFSVYLIYKKGQLNTSMNKPSGAQADISKDDIKKINENYFFKTEGLNLNRYK